MEQPTNATTAKAISRFVQVSRHRLDQPHTYDRRYVSELVSRAYRAANFSPPRFLFFCASPMSMMWAQAMINAVLSGQMGRCVRDEVLGVPLLCGLQGCNEALGVDQAKTIYDAIQTPLLPVTRPRRYAEVSFLRRYGEHNAQFSGEYPDIQWFTLDALMRGGLHECDLPTNAIGPFPCRDIQWGAFSRYMSVLSFARRRLGLEAATETAFAAMELLEEVYAVMAYENVCLVSDWPTYVHPKNEF